MVTWTTVYPSGPRSTKVDPPSALLRSLIERGVKCSSVASRVSLPIWSSSLAFSQSIDTNARLAALWRRSPA